MPSIDGDCGFAEQSLLSVSYRDFTAQGEQLQLTCQIRAIRIQGQSTVKLVIEREILRPDAQRRIRDHECVVAAAGLVVQADEPLVAAFVWGTCCNAILSDFSYCCKPAVGMWICIRSKETYRQSSRSPDHNPCMVRV